MSLPTSARTPAAICLFLALITAAVYWPVTGHPFILYDDEQYIVINHHVTMGLGWNNFVWAFTSNEAANWHPLTWLSHQLDCQLFGLNAGDHHLVNLILHVANSLLVFIFLRGATGAVWRSGCVAALFAWHPMHVESVAWASERKDTLSTFFFMLTLMAYLRFTQFARSPNPKSKIYYGLALTLLACGLMSKPMVVTLPFVLLLLDFWPLNRMTAPPVPAYGRLLLEKIPFFALALAGSVVTYLVQTGAGASWDAPVNERLANAVIAYARYVAKIFWPTDLAIVYSHPEHWPTALALGAAGVLLVWTILCLRRWQRQPYLTIGWFWFLGTLVPTIGIVQVGAQSMADRYSYIPSIGFFIALVWGVAEWGEAKLTVKKYLPLLGGGALAGCLLMTSIQIGYWRDNIRLFRHAVEVTQDNFIAANCLGKAYEKTGDNAHALLLYRETVRLAPRFPQGQFNFALALLAYGQTTEALEHLQAAAALEPHNPDIQFDLGIYFSQQASWSNAVSCFSNSLAVRPDFAPAEHNYACALANLGQFATAAVHYREALRLQPDFADAKKQLSRLLADHPELK